MVDYVHPQIIATVEILPLLVVNKQVIQIDRIWVARTSQPLGSYNSFDFITSPIVKHPYAIKILVIDKIATRSSLINIPCFNVVGY